MKFYMLCVITMMYTHILAHARCNLAINLSEYFFCVHNSKDDSASKCYVFEENGSLSYTVVNCTHVNNNVNNEVVYIGNIPSRALKSEGSQNLETRNHLKVITATVLGYTYWNNII